MRQKQPSGLGQRDGLGSAGTLDQLLADLALEHGDLLADGALRVPESDRRLPERPFAGDGLESQEMAQFDAEPTIRFHNRNSFYLDLS